MCVCAVFKVSYNLIPNPRGPGWLIGPDVEGGICGSAFFVEPGIALTAHHLLNRGNFIPNSGFTHCQYWLLGRNGVAVEFGQAQVECHPDVDTSIIRLSKQTHIPVLPVASRVPSTKDRVYNQGHIAGGATGISLEVFQRGTYPALKIAKIDLSNLQANGSGEIKTITTATVTSRDVNLNDTIVLEVSYGGIVGMSGGPLRLSSTDEVIGLMSFGQPSDSEVKERLFAVAINEIVGRIR